jgi:hypothetical protein
MQFIDFYNHSFIKILIHISVILSLRSSPTPPSLEFVKIVGIGYEERAPVSQGQKMAQRESFY